MVDAYLARPLAEYYKMRIEPWLQARQTCVDLAKDALAFLSNGYIQDTVTKVHEMTAVFDTVIHYARPAEKAYHSAGATARRLELLHAKQGLGLLLVSEGVKLAKKAMKNFKKGEEKGATGREYLEVAQDNLANAEDLHDLAQDLVAQINRKELAEKIDQCSAYAKRLCCQHVVDALRDKHAPAPAPAPTPAPAPAPMPAPTSVEKARAELELMGARCAVADAGMAVTRANAVVVEKREALAKAKAALPPTVDALAQELEDAEAKLVEANRSLVEAQGEVAEAEGEVAEAEGEVRVKRDTLEAARAALAPSDDPLVEHHQACAAAEAEVEAEQAKCNEAKASFVRLKEAASSGASAEPSTALVTRSDCLMQYYDPLVLQYDPFFMAASGPLSKGTLVADLQKSLKTTPATDRELKIMVQQDATHSILEHVILMRDQMYEEEKSEKERLYEENQALLEEKAEARKLLEGYRAQTACAVMSCEGLAPPVAGAKYTTTPPTITGEKQRDDVFNRFNCEIPMVLEGLLTTNQTDEDGEPLYSFTFQLREAPYDMCQTRTRRVLLTLAEMKDVPSYETFYKAKVDKQLARIANDAKVVKAVEKREQSECAVLKAAQKAESKAMLCRLGIKRARSED